jgi:hypothetical protein
VSQANELTTLNANTSSRQQNGHKENPTMFSLHQWEIKDGHQEKKNTEAKSIHRKGDWF